MTTLFVTASGTDVGKTYLCCGLVRYFAPRVALRCIKPIATGFDPTAAPATDTGRLLEAQGLPIDEPNLAATSPWRFAAALSADMAAARERTTIPFDELIEFSRPPSGVRLNVVEGIGGVMAPLDRRHTVLDWIEALGADPLLVVGSYLGSMSHALTALDALDRRGRSPVAIVVSQSPAEPVTTEETAASLEPHCAPVPVMILGRSDERSVTATAARIGRLLELE